MSGPSALACPASLKGVLTARGAARALAEGFALAGVGCDRLPLADGGEGTREALCGAAGPTLAAHDAFGRPRLVPVGFLRGAAVVEAAEVIPYDPERLDAAAASSRGLGELIGALLDVDALIVAIGGTATMDAGAGLLDVLDTLPGRTTVLCDVRTTLYDAPRLFGPQKGATPAQVDELEARFRADARLAPYARLPGSGAAGGLGAALASLGAELVPGAERVLDLAGFEPRGHALAVTGEGRVDVTTAEGKVAAQVARRCAEAGVACVVFGGVVDRPLPGAETVALSGDPDRASADLVELGVRLGTRLLDAAG
jgi:glycerate 2-kinase